MTDEPNSTRDYPLAEKCPDRVTGYRGKSLNELTIDAVLSGDIEMNDLRITPDALVKQAEISRDAGRAALGLNFERAAEMTRMPEETVMEIYELLRPGRTTSKERLLSTGRWLRDEFDAPLLAQLVEEAAEVYENRGLFLVRY
ncbi:diol dehydratase small subunit [Roseovarius ramblicola]|uniref:Diol dehydratase small subunit n=1 Tax=Roseovarius ramblicola TaxID=2022336 RepID=A0ABV5HWI3_9RHOB